ncbi:MAG TPA: Xaa-Pro peptidase family protein [Candidatus Hodarchaeales archaeon]|nr:Xaa-Pro peptidase family protein [Candidatus Hodarchaeales archaeon]
MTLSYLSAEHHQRRRNTLQNSLLKEGLETFLVFNPTNIFYLTGFAFIPTERPLCAILHKGQLSFFVPQLEVEHVKHQVGRLENVFSYFDYPSDEIHPMVRLANILEKEVKINPRQFASEAAGSSPYWGYLGPKLEEIMKNSVKVLPNIVTDMRIIKEEEEIHLLRASSYFAARAHRQLQELTKVGRNEIEVSIEASQAASKEMQSSLGKDYHPRGWTMFPAMAGYRGQVGAHSAFPHATSQGLAFKKGDVLVTGATANVYGYYSELERTMFIQSPTSKQKEYFKVMLEAQQAALDAVKPGKTCADIDRASREVIRKRGLIHLTQHHTGHSLGLEGHERPFLDLGDKTVLQTGMVFSCEPGIYEMGFGGFRPSDTFVVVGDGADLLTDYPRDLEALIL